MEKETVNPPKAITKNKIYGQISSKEKHRDEGCLPIIELLIPLKIVSVMKSFRNSSF